MSKIYALLLVGCTFGLHASDQRLVARSDRQLVARAVENLELNLRPGIYKYELVVSKFLGEQRREFTITNKKNGATSSVVITQGGSLGATFKGEIHRTSCGSLKPSISGIPLRNDEGVFNMIEAVFNKISVKPVVGDGISRKTGQILLF